jgi:hypothetical protein
MTAAGGVALCLEVVVTLMLHGLYNDAAAPWTRSVRAAEGLREALVHARQRLFRHARRRPDARDDDVHYPGTYLAGGYNR